MQILKTLYIIQCTTVIVSDSFRAEILEKEESMEKNMRVLEMLSFEDSVMKRLIEERLIEKSMKKVVKMLMAAVQ
ncbi:predicted protein [Histoplasma mississippiense (nom. inval.)]|uniref:predicted protein n=1 Tax=Ajellomyces capsulatus (strain NAm1 / WU24) TaxID=2059318 RepID=UPI000157BDE6|nr:predicted protein [Histoplasma mississippiense (nom. inval.)]EDN05970.1 predicted protein [Histoplasma mississippiense (nom. inval.)]